MPQSLTIILAVLGVLVAVIVPFLVIFATRNFQRIQHEKEKQEQTYLRVIKVEAQMEAFFHALELQSAKFLHHPTRPALDGLIDKIVDHEVLNDTELADLDRRLIELKRTTDSDFVVFTVELWMIILKARKDAEVA